MIRNFKSQNEYPFVKYIRAGINFETIISIDFSKPNKKVSENLHVVDPKNPGPTDFELAIVGLTNILEEYDTDKEIPVYGFGAKEILRDGLSEVSNFFACSGDVYEPQAIGYASICDLYHKA